MQKHSLQPYWTEKAKAAMKAKRESGIHLGKAPIGYKNVKINGEPAIVIDTETAPLVRMAFQLAARENGSVRSVLRTVTGAGLLRRRGKELQPVTLHGMLTNPFYMGKVRHNGELPEAFHEPLVTEKTFGMVQGRLRHNRRHL